MILERKQQNWQVSNYNNKQKKKADLFEYYEDNNCMIFSMLIEVPRQFF